MPTALCCVGYKSGPLSSQVVPLHVSAWSYMSVIQILVIVISILLAVGILTCILNHYKMGARSWSDQRNRQRSTSGRQQQQQHQQQANPHQTEYSYSLSPTTARPMYSSTALQERQRLEAAAHQDHLVRIHSVHTDLALNLPHSIALPDGEEGHECDINLLNLHDPEQHAELTRSFIRPPPNRTVPESNCLPPFRSNSVSLLQKPSTPLTQVETAVLVTRSYSVSSNSKTGKLNNSCGPSHPNPVSSHIWLPSCMAINSRMSVNSGNSNRTYGYTPTNNKYDTGTPPSYSDVLNQMDLNTVSRQKKNGV